MKVKTLVTIFALMAVSGPSLWAAVTMPMFPRPSGMAALPALNLARPFSLPSIGENRPTPVEERVRIAILVKTQA